jgi:hypothetical protein
VIAATTPEDIDVIAAVRMERLDVIAAAPVSDGPFGQEGN